MDGDEPLDNWNRQESGEIRITVVRPDVLDDEDLALAVENGFYSTGFQAGSDKKGSLVRNYHPRQTGGPIEWRSTTWMPVQRPSCTCKSPAQPRWRGLSDIRMLTNWRFRLSPWLNSGLLYGGVSERVNLKLPLP